MFHPMTLVFLIAVGSHLAAQWWLSFRQVKHVRQNRDAVPTAFAAAIPVESHRKAADYTIARHRLGRLEMLWDALLLLLLTLGGGIGALGALTQNVPFGPVTTGTLHVLSVFLLLGLASLPFSIWR